VRAMEGGYWSERGRRKSGFLALSREKREKNE